MSNPTATNPPAFAIIKNRTRFFGLSMDECIQAFFGGNALIAVVVLGLITLFLFREGYDFFNQNHHNVTVYRRAGLEYVDIIRQKDTDHAALSRYLSDIRLRTLNHLLKEQHLPLATANAQLAAYDDFSANFADAFDPVRGLLSELTETCTAIKEQFTVAENKKTERDQLLAAGKSAAAAQVVINDIDFKVALQPVIGRLPEYKESIHTVAERITAALSTAPALPTPELQKRLERFKQLARDHVDQFAETIRQMEQWDYSKPVSFGAAFTGFIFGREWLTASFWQDWYGILPLFIGSLMVSIIALLIAVPLGVGAAIYVNQIATPVEQRLIKPAIEFISAIPSVVLGFFGIAVLGTLLRAVSQTPWLSWVPGFPMSERLNGLTAGCLLAFLSIPTIFTLAEDAINNVPRSFKEASFALGANRLQTILKIIVPAGLSGIISAILLGFGRVMGETMVVLLCAGNRIAIPDFTAGLGVVTQPVHTMTGIIAQEMGEVANGSIHYRALFMVGIVLFFLSLAINYVAQVIVRRYKISIG
ncbi:MAG: phosphate ABC transporter permease subunit PstC [Verrucomicrobia bacterium]|nr:phosphate ABC transporter permease subunit PstC [Verrucomicrobiota bacterium]